MSNSYGSSKKTGEYIEGSPKGGKVAEPSEVLIDEEYRSLPPSQKGERTWMRVNSSVSESSNKKVFLLDDSETDPE
jgi:hypothetical protein